LLRVGATQKVHACDAVLGFLRVSNRGYNPVFFIPYTFPFSLWIMRTCLFVTIHI
jgi:hypothetical protein